MFPSAGRLECSTNLDLDEPVEVDETPGQDNIEDAMSLSSARNCGNSGAGIETSIYSTMQDCYIIMWCLLQTIFMLMN